MTKYEAQVGTILLGHLGIRDIVTIILKYNHVINHATVDACGLFPFNDTWRNWIQSDQVKHRAWIRRVMLAHPVLVFDSYNSRSNVSIRDMTVDQFSSMMNQRVLIPCCQKVYIVQESHQDVATITQDFDNRTFTFYDYVSLAETIRCKSATRYVHGQYVDALMIQRIDIVDEKQGLTFVIYVEPVCNKFKMLY